MQLRNDDITCPVREKARLLARIAGLEELDSGLLSALMERVDEGAVMEAASAALEEAGWGLDEELFRDFKGVLLGECRDELWKALASISYRALKEGRDPVSIQAAFLATVRALQEAATGEEAKALAAKALWSTMMIGEAYRFLLTRTIYEGIGVDEALMRRILEKYVDEALRSLAGEAGRAEA